MRILIFLSVLCNCMHAAQIEQRESSARLLRSHEVAGYSHSRFLMRTHGITARALLVDVPQPIVDKLYRMIADLDQILRSAQISYWIDGGTLLGAVRSSGLIRWDDDADICMFEDDIERLKLLEPVLRDKGYRLSKTSVCYKISCISDTPYSGKDWSFPFLDIFAMRRLNERIHYVFNFRLPDCPRKPFYMLDQEVFPLREYVFGPLKLWGPQHNSDYLRWWYGDWQHVAWRDFDHQTLHGVKKIPVALTDELRKPALPSVWPPAYF